MSLSNTQKLLFSIALICFAIFFGGNILRSAIAYDLFIPSENFLLKPDYTNAMRMHSMYIYAITAFYTDFSYGFTFLIMLIATVQLRKELKKEAWLFMIIVLFFITAPINIFNLYYDYKLNIAIYYNHLKEFTEWDVQEWFVKRFTDTKFNSANTISFFSSITCIAFMIWQPLKKLSDSKQK